MAALRSARSGKHMPQARNAAERNRRGGPAAAHDEAGDQPKLAGGPFPSYRYAEVRRRPPRSCLPATLCVPLSNANVQPIKGQREQASLATLGGEGLPLSAGLW